MVVLYQDDIKEVVDYAAKRHIMIVPEIEMPGHASAAIASYPWLGTTGKQIKVPCNFGVHYNAYNVADPRVINFRRCIGGVIALFPSRLFISVEMNYDIMLGRNHRWYAII